MGAFRVAAEFGAALFCVLGLPWLAMWGLPILMAGFAA